MHEWRFIIKKLEAHIHNRNWEEARSALENAKQLQPNNPYLRAFAERIEIESAQTPK